MNDHTVNTAPDGGGREAPPNTGDVRVLDGAEPDPATETTGDPSETRDESALPEWVRAELASAREETQRFQDAARDLRGALEAAKSPEEFEAVAGQVTELETALHRERLARTHRLPDDLADRIRGETSEEREADARALSELFHARALLAGRGGLDPTAAQASPADPASLARMIPRGRH